MPIPDKRRLTGPKPQQCDDVVRARRIMWSGWIDECVEMHEALVEGMLANLPSADNG